MKERPMLFSNQQMRTLLSGQQRQTRRIMKSRAYGPSQDNHEGCYGIDVLHNNLQGNYVLTLQDFSAHCPYGQVGDRLWVRESWRGPRVTAAEMAQYQQQPARFQQRRYCQYYADTHSGGKSAEGGDWQAGIHMPRWASRIVLRITDVRVEKIQQIADNDIIAEGVQFDNHFLNNFFTLKTDPVSPGEAWRRAWISQYGENSWQANPWVWVIDFVPLTALADETAQRADDCFFPPDQA